jgi:hypothetical protein
LEIPQFDSVVLPVIAIFKVHIFFFLFFILLFCVAEKKNDLFVVCPVRPNHEKSGKKIKAAKKKVKERS